MLGIACHEDLLATLAADQGGDLLELASGALLLDFEGLFGDLVLVEAGGVAPAAQQQGGVGLVGLDNLLLDLDVDGRLLGAHEAGAHIDTASTKAEGGGQSPAVGEATAGDEGHLERLAGLAEQDEVCKIGLANVAGALEAVDAEEVDAHLDGALGVADGGALVQDDNAGLLELGNDGARGVAGRLDNLDALIDDGLGVGAVVGGHHGGQEGNVDTEGVLGQGSAASDLLAQVVGRGEDEGGDDAEAASVGHGGGEVGGANVHHAALDDGDCR